MNRPAPKIAISLLGQFEIRRSGNAPVIQIKSRKGRALIAYLAMHLDQLVPRSRVASLLWEDQSEQMGRQNLRQILAELREDVGLEFDSGISKETIQLDSRHFEVDAIRFLNCAHNKSDPAAAVTLYAGDLTSDLEIRNSGFDEWLSQERRRLHSLALDIFDARVKALDEAGDKKQALAVCERLLTLDPLRETTHRLLLPLEAAVNGRGSALARAEALTRVLREQLGVAPEPATMAMISALSNAVAANEPRRNTEPRTHEIADPPPTRLRKRYLAAAAAIALVLAGAAGWYFAVLNGERNLPAQQKSVKSRALPGTFYSIAVLPFTARADSDQVKRFTNALEEDVIDTLSRAPRVLVISRQTSRSYRDTNKDAREIGKELNVDFLLTGNVDLDGDKLFIRAQLIDTQGGQLVWSDRFMHTKDVSYSVFEEIVTGVARQLHLQIMFTEANKRIKAERENPTYDDLVQRGWAEMFRSFTKHESAEQALKLFEEAVLLNPRHGTARLGIAGILLRRNADLRSPDRVKDLERAIALLTDVLKDHPENGTAHFFLGIANKQRGRNADSIVEFEKALKSNPSNAHAHAQLGHSLIFLGRAGEAEPHVQKAIRLSPQDPTISSWYLFAGQAKMHQRKYDEAIRWFERSIESYPRSGRTQIYLAAAYMLKGNRDAAVEAAKRALKELPKLSADSMNNFDGDAVPEYLAERDRIRDAMREALKLAREM